MEKEKYEFKTSEKPAKKSDKIVINKKYVWIILAAVIVIVLAAAYLVISKSAPVEQKVEIGDTAQVRYIGKFVNGTVFDTNYEDIAKQNNIIRQSYTPLSFVAGSGNLIKGFDNAVLGMRVGQKKTVEISPEDGYGPIDETKIQYINRVQELNRTVKMTRLITIPIETFTSSFNQTPALGKQMIYGPENSTYIVMNFDAVNVTIRKEFTVGQIIKSSASLPWNSTVVAVNNETVTLRHNPIDSQKIEDILGYSMISVTEDKIKITIYSDVGKEIQTIIGTAKVIMINETQIGVDFNSPMAGKTLIFDIELVKLDKTVPVVAG